MAAVIQHPAAYGAQPEDWQHFDMLLQLTEDLLPVVSNPKATISGKSSMRDLGKVPSIYNEQRHAVGFTGWTQHRSSPADIARWSRERDYGISLQTRRVRAIDVDVADVDLAQQIHGFLQAHWGDAPWRTRSNASKFLLAFDMPGEFTKRKFTTAHGIVEFLATGQQFIAVGTHPSGVRYHWNGGSLPDEFPRIAPELFEEVWARLVATFGIEESSTSSASVKGQKLADVIANDAVAQFLLNTNLVKRAERDGRLHITCPFELDHTAESGDSATTYFPAHTGGYVNGHFQCLHAHCEHRSDQEFLDAINYFPANLASEFEAIGEGSAARVDHGHASGAPEAAPAAAQADADPKARFTFQPAHEFAVGTPPPWMVKGVLPHAVLGVIYGESTSGKTFAALDLAVAVATGSPWRDRAVQRGQVAYIAAEGAGGFRARLKAVAQHRGVELADIPIVVLADAPNMMEKQDALDVARAIVAAGGAQLVIVDTFAQVMPGANENAGEDVGRALAHCKGIHRATGAMVLLVHHSGKDASRGARGWSGLRAAADVEMEVVRADDRRSLTVTKMKDGEDGSEFGFRLETIVVGIDSEGEEVSSCIVQHSDEKVGSRRSAKARRALGGVEQIVLCEMDSLMELGTAHVEHAVLKAACVAQLSQDEGKRDQRGTRVERAIESLLGGGWIARDGVHLKRKEQE
jgi:hypothetical protein